MTTFTLAPPAARRPSLSTFVAIAALHLGLLVLLARWGVVLPLVSGPALQVRLLQPPAPRAAAQPELPLVRRSPVDPPPLSLPVPTVEPSTAWAGPAPAAGAQPDLPAAPAAALPPVGPASLDLRLDPARKAERAPANAAVEAQVGRSAPKTLESRLAGTLAGGPWAEQRLDNDTIRLKRGNQCILLKRPRGAQLDPMGPGSRSPWMAGPVHDCG